MAITVGGTPTTWTTSVTNTGPGTDFTHTVTSGTTFLYLVVSMEADFALTVAPSWNGSETMSLVTSTSTSGASGDVRQYIYGLVNPTATTANITWTQESNDNGHGTAINYLGSISSSVADATNFIDQTVNNVAATTVDLASGGTAGATLIASAVFFGGDGEPATNGEGFSDRANSATGGSSVADLSFYVADLIGGAPSGCVVDWTGTASDECAGLLIELLPEPSGPVVFLPYHSKASLRRNTLLRM